MNKITANKGITNAEQTRGARRAEAESAREGQKPASVQSPASSPSSQVSDAVKVSEQASAVGRLVERATEGPDIRQERVEALRARIESGDYDPSTDTIADAILQDEASDKI